MYCFLYLVFHFDPYIKYLKSYAHITIFVTLFGIESCLTNLCTNTLRVSMQEGTWGVCFLIQRTFISASLPRIYCGLL